jgi:hypothetical protein
MHVDSKERHRTGRIGWLRAAYWARTTASFQHRAWCSVSQLRMRLTATYWSQASPAWWLGLCRWLQVSTCLSSSRNRSATQWRKLAGSNHYFQPIRY